MSAYVRNDYKRYRKNGIKIYMGKFRDWMHGRGRNTVITLIVVIAFAMIAHYFIVERQGKWGLESAYSADVQETVSPNPQKDYYVGGDSIGKIQKGTTIATGDTISKGDGKK